jgi:hypothetical protein
VLDNLYEAFPPGTTDAASGNWGGQFSLNDRLRPDLRLDLQIAHHVCIHARRPGGNMKLPAKKRRYRRRLGRCYALAAQALLDVYEADKETTATLVHGRTGVGPHAWIECDGEVYDAVLDRTMSIAQYAAEWHAVVERRYTFLEACAEVAKEKHLGPWHESEYLAARIAEFEARKRELEAAVGKPPQATKRRNRLKQRNES